MRRRCSFSSHDPRALTSRCFSARLTASSAASAPPATPRSTSIASAQRRRPRCANALPVSPARSSAATAASAAWTGSRCRSFLTCTASIRWRRSHNTPPKAQVAALRDTYRRAHLRSLAPDAPGGKVPRGNWFQLVGSVYDRHIVGFTVRTTREQDDRLIRALQSRENRSHFNFFFRNCADFSRDALNLWVPDAMKDNFIADLRAHHPETDEQNRH